MDQMDFSVITESEQEMLRKNIVTPALSLNSLKEIADEVTYFDTISGLMPNSKKKDNGEIFFDCISETSKKRDGTLTIVRFQPLFKIPSNSKKRDYQITQSERDVYISLLNVWLNQDDDMRRRYLAHFPDIHLEDKPVFFTINDLCAQMGKSSRSWYSIIKKSLENLSALYAKTTIFVHNREKGVTTETPIEIKFLEQFGELRSNKLRSENLYYAVLNEDYAKHLTSTNLANIRTDKYFGKFRGYAKTILSLLLLRKESYGESYTIKLSQLVSYLSIPPGATLAYIRRVARENLEEIKGTGEIDYNIEKDGPDDYLIHIWHLTKSKNGVPETRFFWSKVSKVWGSKRLNSIGITEDFYLNLIALTKHNEKDKKSREVITFYNQSVDAMEHTIEIVIHNILVNNSNPSNLVAYARGIYNKLFEASNGGQLVNRPTFWVKSIEEHYRDVVSREIQEEFKKNIEKGRKKAIEDREALKEGFGELWKIIKSGQDNYPTLQQIKSYFYYENLLPAYYSEKDTVLELYKIRRSMNPQAPHNKKDIEKISQGLKERREKLWEEICDNLESLCFTEYSKGTFQTLLDKAHLINKRKIIHALPDLESSIEKILEVSPEIHDESGRSLVDRVIEDRSGVRVSNEIEVFDPEDLKRDVGAKEASFDLPELIGQEEFDLITGNLPQSRGNEARKISFSI